MHIGGAARNITVVHLMFSAGQSITHASLVLQVSANVCEDDNRA